MHIFSRSHVCNYHKVFIVPTIYNLYYPFHILFVLNWKHSDCAASSASKTHLLLNFWSGIVDTLKQHPCGLACIKSRFSKTSFQFGPNPQESYLSTATLHLNSFRFQSFSCTPTYIPSAGWVSSGPLIGVGNEWEVTLMLTLC